MTAPPPVRVMYVVPDLAVGGAERHVTMLMPSLDRSRFTTAVICIGAEGSLFTDLVSAGTPAIALNRTKRQALAALVDLVRHMRRFAPDVVITRGYSAEMLGRVAAVVARVPHRVVWVHNHGDTERRSGIRRLADRLLDTVTDAYYGVAEAQLNYLTDELRYPAEKVRIIRNGIATEQFAPAHEGEVAARSAIEPSGSVVGIVAALRAEKDHRTFLRAARLIVDQAPHTKFLIVGDGPERPAIERGIARLGLTGCVTLTGCRADIPELLSQMDVFALCSYTVECLPLALLEAMAAGLPAVCTTVGGVPDIVDDGVTGYLVPPRDPAALADRILAILNDRELAHRMGSAARQRVAEHFSLAANVAATERALEDLTRGPSGHAEHRDRRDTVPPSGDPRVELIDCYKGPLR